MFDGRAQAFWIDSNEKYAELVDIELLLLTGECAVTEGYEANSDALRMQRWKIVFHDEVLNGGNIYA